MSTWRMRLFFAILSGISLLSLACSDDKGSPATCEPGTFKCPCTVEGTCVGDMTCTAEGVCLPPTSNNGPNNGNNGSNNGSNNGNNGTNNGVPFAGVGLRVADAGARACEVLIADPDGVLGEVTTSAQASARALTRPPRTSIAFLRKGDGRFADGDVELQVRGGAAAAGTLQIVSQHCYGADGAELGGASVSILR